MYLIQEIVLSSHLNARQSHIYIVLSRTYSQYFLLCVESNLEHFKQINFIIAYHLVFSLQRSFPFKMLFYSSGKLNLNAVPFPSGLFSAHILPPCASTMLFEMNNPNPVPVSDLETNFVKSRGNISLSMPVPVSLTLTMNSFFLSSFLTSSAETEMVPDLVNFKALLTRLEST